MKVFTMKTCDKCHKLIEELKKENIPFHELDADENYTDAIEYAQKTGNTAMPMVVINEQVINNATIEDIKTLNK